MLRRVLLGLVGAVLLLALLPPVAARASATAPTVSLDTHQVSSETGATVVFAADPGGFLYSGQVIIRMQLSGFTASAASSATACGWIGTSPSRTTGGCNFFNSGGSAYLDFSVANGGALIGNVTYTITIPSPYLTTPATPGNYNAYGAHETTGSVFINSSATAVGIDNSQLSALSVASATLTPTFASGTTSYSAAVGNATSSVTVTPTAASPANATIRVNGTVVSSGTASSAIALAVGANTITVTVTGAFASSVQTYTIAVTRAGSAVSSLSSLVCGSCILDPLFSSGTTSYASTVANDVSSITITPTSSDANATVTVNGSAVSSGTASAAIPLSAGSNTITIVVTAQDSSTTTYSLVIVRLATLASNSPADWQQAYGRASMDEGCLEGWNPSWAQWVNEGRGGPTCERRLHWSASVSMWVTLPGLNS